MRVTCGHCSQICAVQVASVMGMSVSLDLLLDIYPIATSREALQRDLIDLEAARFLRATDVPGTWMMTQVTQPSSFLYGLLLQSRLSGRMDYHVTIPSKGKSCKSMTAGNIL